MKFATLGALAGLAASLGALVGCGGGETTTVIEKTVIERPEPAPESEAPALLKLPTYETWTVEPELYSFGVSGDPAGHELVWSGWGSNRAEGRGMFWTRRYEGGNNPSDYDKEPATIIATDLEECEGRLFYTGVEAVPDEGEGEARVLETPCTGSEKFSPDAIEEIEEDNQPDPPPETPPDPFTFFHTPTENIGCAISRKGARCDIQQHEWQPPPRPSDCNLDWGYGLSLDTTGPGEFFCGGDSVFGVGEAVGYGQSISRGEFECAVSRSGVECENRLTGHGFALSRQEARGF